MTRGLTNRAVFKGLKEWVLCLGLERWCQTGSCRCICVLLIPSYNLQRVHWQWWSHGWGHLGCIHIPELYYESSFVSLWPRKRCILSAAVQGPATARVSLRISLPLSLLPAALAGRAWPGRDGGIKENYNALRDLGTRFHGHLFVLLLTVKLEVEKDHQLYLLDKETA